MMKKIKVKLLSGNAKMPTYGSEDAAGADLYACLEEAVIIQPGVTRMIPTGLSMEIPCGYAGLIYARSGLACKQDLAPANKVGVIDADYRGEIMVALYNQSSEEQTVLKGERIAQLVLLPCPQAQFTLCKDLDDTDRGEGGFGSTGRK